MSKNWLWALLFIRSTAFSCLFAQKGLVALHFLKKRFATAPF